MNSGSPVLSLDPEMRRFHTRVRDSRLALDLSTLSPSYFYKGPGLSVHYMVTPVIIKDACG